MITCSQCGAQNLPGMAYCENCGAPLPQATAAPAGAAVAPQAGGQDAGAVPAAASTVTQPDPAAAALPQPVLPVDQMPSPADMGAPSPAAAGANLVAAEPAAAPADSGAGTAAPIDAGAVAPSAGTVAPSAGADTGAPPAAPTPVTPAPAAALTLAITFPSGQVYTMQDDEVNVGRADVAQNWHPELDVIPYGGGAPDLGVSRHQARLVRQDSGFAVIDMGSTNGTYVNGRAAPYNQPVALNDGDTLSFGALNTQIAIK